MSYARSVSDIQKRRCYPEAHCSHCLSVTQLGHALFVGRPRYRFFRPTIASPLFQIFVSVLAEVIVDKVFEILIEYNAAHVAYRFTECHQMNNVSNAAADNFKPKIQPALNLMLSTFFQKALA